MPGSKGDGYGKRAAAALLMVWADIDPEFEAISPLYDEEHRHCGGARLSERRPLCCAEGSPKYLALYGARSAGRIAQPRRFSTAFGSGRRRGASRLPEDIGRNYLLNGYRQIFPVHSNPIEQVREPAPFLQMGRIDIPAMVRGGVQRLVTIRVYPALS